MNTPDEITPAWLRSIGFRIDSSHVDNQPHMVAMLDSRMETALEVSRSIGSDRNWTCWLRSDLAHTRARFCYVRTVGRRSEMLELLRGLTGRDPQTVEIELEQFEAAYAHEAIECQRRYTEYAKGDRWPHVPGR